MRKLYTLPLSPASLRDVVLLHILGILFFFSTSSSVFGQNHAPVANDAYFSNVLMQSTSTSLRPLVHDVDNNLDTMGFRILILPNSGTVSLNPKGDFIYTTQISLYVEDSFKYSICDKDGVCDTGTVYISSNFEKKPVTETHLVSSSYINQSLPFKFNLPNYPSYLCTKADKSVIVIKPNIVLNTDSLNGKIVNDTFYPNKDFIGLSLINANLRYNFPDTSVLNDVQIRVFNILPLRLGEFSEISETVLVNDTLTVYPSYASGPISSTTLIKNATNGFVEHNINNYKDLVYIPNKDFIGLDTFVVTICNSVGICDTTKFIIQILQRSLSTIKIQSSATDVCLGAFVDISEISANGIGPLNRQWEVSSDGANFQAILGATSPYFIPETTETGIKFYRSVLESGDGTSTPSNVIYLNVHPDPILVSNPIDVNLNYIVGTTVATTDAVFNATISGGTGTLFYQWQSSTDGFNWTNLTETPSVSGTKATTLTLKKPSINAAPYYQVVSNASGVGCDATTSTSAFLSFTLNTATNPPVAGWDAVTITQNTIVAINIGATDFDLDNNLDMNSYQFMTIPLYGTVTMKPNGTCLYTPNQNFFGQDSLIYRVCDLTGNCDTAIVRITVNPVQQFTTLVARYTTFTTETNQLKSFSLINSVSSPNNNINLNSFSIVQNTKDGILTLNSNGNFTYQSVNKPNLNGYLDSFSYKVCDNLGLCDTAKATLLVKSIAHFNSQQFSLFVNDTIGDNMTRMLLPNVIFTRKEIILQPSNGRFNFNKINNDFVYYPNQNFIGNDKISIDFCDANLKCDRASLLMSVSSTVFAIDDNFQIKMNQTLADSVTANDGIFATKFGFYTIKNPLNGTINFDTLKGKFAYSPKLNFVGKDSFTYILYDKLYKLKDTAVVNIAINSQAIAPVAKDSTFTTNINTTLINSVKKLASDVNNNLDTSSFTPINAPVHGSFTMNQFGDFTYNPTTNFFGIDSVSYKICDKGIPVLCDTGIIFIKVVNNNPALSITAQPLNIEQCLGGSTALQVGIAGGTGVVTYTWQQSNDGVNFIAIAGATMPSFMPFSTMLGTTFYRCVIKAGTETVTSNSANVTVKPSIAFTSQPVNIKLLYKAGTVVADSNAVFKAAITGGSGAISYQWQCSSNNSTWSNLTENTTNVGTKTTTLTLVKPKISEVPYFHLVASASGSGCQAATSATGILTFEVRATANIAPNAVDDNFTTIQAVAVNATVATNDTDTEGALNLTSFKIVKSPKNGNLTMFNNGAFTYTPATPFIGNDTASYSVCDVPGLCDTAFVFFKVIKGNHLPTIAKDAFATKMNTALKASVALNDSDFDNNLNKNSYKIITNPKNGNVKMWANGDVLYLPKQNFIGKDTFYYQACDSLGLCGIAEATVVIRGGFITGKIYYDANNNGAFDNGDLGVPNELVTFDTDGKTFTSSIGDFQIVADTSKSYVITPILNNPLWMVAPLSKTVKTSNNFDQLIENQYFAVRPASQVSDLAVNVEAGNARPGFSSVTTLTYYNKGTTVLNGKVSLTLDNNVTYESTDVTLAQRSGNVLTWSVVNLQPFESRNLMIFTKTNVSAPLNGNVVYAYEGSLTGATDVDATNSKGTATIAIRGSYDPNDITVDRREYIRKATDATTPNVPLAYTIRFQNTGNAEAIRVEVLDTIQEKLDLTAFEMIAASHKFEVQIVPDTNKVKRTYTVVKWIFDNINLLDSTAKEACSHGFVKYSIKNISTKTNYVKDSILNKAAIYFDFNAPVITNTATTKFSTLTVSSLEQYNLEFKAYPNPTNGLVNIELAHEADATIEIFNAVGQSVSRQILRGSNGQIDMSTFQTGFYILKIKTQKGSGSVKIHKE